MPSVFDSAADHARGLTARGERSARAIGQRLVELAWAPDCGMASDALRAHTTAALAGQAFSPFAWDIRPELYLAATPVLIEAVASLGDSPHSTLIVVAHNPTLSDAVSELSGEHCVLAPADAALLTIHAENWAETEGRSGEWEMCGIYSPLV